MALLARDLASITEADIRGLVDIRAREDARLEFKRELYRVDENSQKREMVFDTTAMANADGGDLILGIAEKEGCAHAADGVDLDEAAKFSSRLPQIVLSNTEPQLAGLRVRVIATQEGKKAFIVVRVASSMGAPHRERTSGHFYERTSHGKVQMSVDSLRSAFLRQEVVLDSFDAFRRERVAHLIGNQKKGWWGQGFPSIAIHAAPIHSLTRHARRQLDLQALAPKDLSNHFDVDATLFNALGFLRYTRASEQFGGFGFQIFLDGRYEAIGSGNQFDKVGMVLPESTLIYRVANTWTHLKALEENFGICPFLIGVSAWNLSLTYFGTLHGGQMFQCKDDNNEAVMCSEVRFDSVPDTAIEFGRLMSTSLLPLFTAFGRGKVELSMEPARWSED